MITDEENLKHINETISLIEPYENLYKLKRIPYIHHWLSLKYPDEDYSFVPYMVNPEHKHPKNFYRFGEEDWDYNMGFNQRISMFYRRDDLEDLENAIGMTMARQYWAIKALVSKSNLPGGVIRYLRQWSDF